MAGKLAQRVYNGLKFLDSVDAQAVLRIDADILNIGHWKHCILGQLFAGDLNALTTLNISKSVGESLGFYAVKDNQQEYRILTRIWQHAIRKRQAKEQSNG